VCRQLLSASQLEDRFGGRRILIGEALCASGRTSEGRHTLNAGVASLVESGVHRDNPEVARARAIAGRCALAAGDRRQAVELAWQAREAFIKQPDVSSYFKKPSEELDRSLGMTTQPR
jgi:hypothetical protein